MTHRPTSAPKSSPFMRLSLIHISILNVPAEWKFIGYFCLGYAQADDTIPELEQAGWEQRRLPSSIIIRR